MNYKRIYIAGKVTGRAYRSVREEFAQVKHFLLSEGFDEEINPCEIVVPGTSWADAMLILLPYLATCNYLALLPSYDRSEGAMCEYHFARGMENEGKMHGIIHVTITKSTTVTHQLENIQMSDSFKQAI